MNANKKLFSLSCGASPTTFNFGRCKINLVDNLHCQCKSFSDESVSTSIVSKSESESRLNPSKGFESKSRLTPTLTFLKKK